MQKVHHSLETTQFHSILFPLSCIDSLCYIFNNPDNVHGKFNDYFMPHRNVIHDSVILSCQHVQLQEEKAETLSGLHVGDSNTVTGTSGEENICHRNVVGMLN